jgi:hypothetical protein
VATTISRRKLVNGVVVAILDAGADTAGPRGPEAIADPALAEGCHERGRSDGGIAGVEGVSEVEVFRLERVDASGYPREYVLVFADGGEGRIVLDPAQHVRYTGGIPSAHPR